MHTARAATLGEEIANAVSHGVGAGLAVAGLSVGVTFAAFTADLWKITAVAVYGVTLVLLFLASTLYHAIPHDGARKVLLVLDHACIYLLIAGTYTPFTLVTLRGPWGWSLFAVVWGLALAGVVFKVFAAGRFYALSTALYAGMGWIGVIAAGPLVRALDPVGVGLLVAGGVAYTAGIVFFVRDGRYHHLVWHLFVLLGAALHFAAVLGYVVHA